MILYFLYKIFFYCEILDWGHWPQERYFIPATQHPVINFVLFLMLSYKTRTRSQTHSLTIIPSSLDVPRGKDKPWKSARLSRSVLAQTGHDTEKDERKRWIEMQAASTGALAVSLYIIRFTPRPIHTKGIQFHPIMSYILLISTHFILHWDSRKYFRPIARVFRFSNVVSLLLNCTLIGFPKCIYILISPNIVQICAVVSVSFFSLCKCISKGVSQHFQANVTHLKLCFI